MTPGDANLVLGVGIYLGVALAAGVGLLTRLNWQRAREIPRLSTVLAVLVLLLGALAWPVGLPMLRRARLV